MDPTQEIKQILGEMALQIATLQCELRLRKAQSEILERACNADPDEQQRILSEYIRNR